ncbi:tRNA-U20a,U20b-dihydrouridine synthase [Draconibacterium orientale]|uniref:tRNA-dihydrouridine synthase n=1 Tax=Draconibacterium orientale TaxID=1168034 RepID=X5DG42_9BACT|nr:tRNA-dihydrouridine synthase family protein [Draconibacterium orientale]AHW59367.1 dihydrouridine synthase [Draconibacterium orientale]SEU08859.1 tRNA-U20a,U20b-dihydrouridine synthase [Draconibacterium orientale]
MEAKIYMAPLQGFTDYVYRAAYAKVFNTVDAYFVPYISLKNNVIPNKYVREILPENNEQSRVVPQILAKDAAEFESLENVLAEHNYSELNLNLGCPYPMVTNRGKGSGLLPFPDEIDKILEHFYTQPKGELSVKLRAGYKTADEIKDVINVLNQFPLKEVILHARVAGQLYSGEIDENAFAYATQNLKHKLVYNGDIFSMEDFIAKQNKFPGIDTWMLGRGILMNPLLPHEIKGIQVSPQERFDWLNTFHQTMLKSYLEVMDNEGNALNKMKQFWIYFSWCFPNQRKLLKHIKKVKSLNKYGEIVKSAFYEI